MTDFVFTGKQLKEYGWDGNLATLEDFKKKLKAALELGWNPNEISLQTFYIRLAALIGRTLRGDETSPEDLKVPLACESSNATQTSDDEDDEDDDDDEDDIDSRRCRAEEAGWDEEEMDLEEFEDYYL